MKNWLFRVLTVVAVFASVSAVAAEKEVAEFGQDKALTVQELNLHRDKYDGKIVRVRGVFVSGNDTYRLDSVTGPIRDPNDPKSIIGCISLSESKRLEAEVARRRWKNSGFVKIPMTLVGRFTASTASPDPNFVDMTEMMTSCGAGSFLGLKKDD